MRYKVIDGITYFEGDWKYRKGNTANGNLYFSDVVLIVLGFAVLIGVFAWAYITGTILQ